MEQIFINRETSRRGRPNVAGGRVVATLLTAVLLVATAASRAGAQERILFPKTDNVKNAILSKIWNEKVRIDVAMWLLTEHEISAALVGRHKAGVTVRVIGDRASIFESDPTTRKEYEYLATNGIPIRLRYHPTYFPEAMHWKAGIFVGQNTVEFGSANWTPFELRPTTTGYKDETAMFTDDPEIVQGFKSEFQKMWLDTTKFLDWPVAYRTETGQPWTAPMTIDRSTPPDVDLGASVDGMIWGQGSEMNNAMVTEINRETQAVYLVSYRLTVNNITNALISKKNAGVPVRVMIEQTQYRNIGFPEYWLVGATTDRLWTAGVEVKQRLHSGLTHMKLLLTSNIASVGSSNLTKNWQRDHNYFVSALAKPQIYTAIRDYVETMWNDPTAFAPFRPQKPNKAPLLAPADAAVGVSTSVKLEWERTPWAIFFDVYLGTTTSNMSFIGRVNAVVNETPPAKYSITPTQLLPGTKYFWRVQTRTYATEKDPSLVNLSLTRSFTTAGTSGGEPPPPPPPPPPTGSTPFKGSPFAIPGAFQSEDFDNGGEGVAYHDTTPGNVGVNYRATDVDIAPTSGGYAVGWIGASEWLLYTVNVTASGNYRIVTRVASEGAGGTFHIEFGGVNKTGPLSVPNTGGWFSYVDLPVVVSLSAGVQSMRVVFDTNSPTTGAIGNLSYFNITKTTAQPTWGGSTTTSATPFRGSPWVIPGAFQAEDFDNGGEGVAYHDTTPGNTGGYRATDVDIAATASGYAVGSTAASEWLRYTVNVTASGSYRIVTRVASEGAGGTFHIEFGGVNKTGPLNVPSTGGWKAYVDLPVVVSLSAGVQSMRVVFDTNSSTTGTVGNLSYFNVTRTTESTMSGPTQPSVEPSTGGLGGTGDPALNAGGARFAPPLVAWRRDLVDGLA